MRKKFDVQKKFIFSVFCISKCIYFELCIFLIVELPNRKVGYPISNTFHMLNFQNAFILHLEFQNAFFSYLEFFLHLNFLGWYLWKFYDGLYLMQRSCLCIFYVYWIADDIIEWFDIRLCIAITDFLLWHIFHVLRIKLILSVLTA